ncbi:MAG: hypothetical protein ACLFVL_04415 [Candidatus Aenigmatarchaeota archaeon]
MSEKKEVHKCPLCGNEFDQGEASACKSCPIGGRCNMTRCPNCGYEFILGVDER